jgi:hypothetical protein
MAILLVNAILMNAFQGKKTVNAIFAGDASDFDDDGTFTL